MNESLHEEKSLEDRVSPHILLRRFIAVLICMLMCVAILALLYINGKSIYEVGL